MRCRRRFSTTDGYRLYTSLFFKVKGSFFSGIFFIEVLQTVQTMKHIFIGLQYIGLWRPVHWRPGWKTKFYHCYTLLIMCAMIIPTLSQFIALMTYIDDVEQVAANAFMILTMMLDCGKATNILIKRHEIIELTNSLVQDPCMPRNENEFTIQRKYDRLVRSLTLGYGSLVSSVLVLVTVKSILLDLPQKALPYKAWLPFDCYESIMGYAIVYTTQLVTVCIGSAIGITFDTFLPGLMVQTCAQLNILKQRFLEMPKLLPNNSSDFNERTITNLSISTLESKLLGQRVKHHLEIFKLGSLSGIIIFRSAQIYCDLKEKSEECCFIVVCFCTKFRFAKKSNDTFSIMIFLQCVVSASVICLSLLQLSKMKLFSTEFTSLLMYIIVMLTQIFIYCFHGCQVTLESLTIAEAIYEIDWHSLSISTQRSLLTIMARTLRPIEFISGHVVTLNLESFNSLMKFSYSAYNVLQQSEES